MSDTPNLIWRNDVDDVYRAHDHDGNRYVVWLMRGDNELPWVASGPRGVRQRYSLEAAQHACQRMADAEMWADDEH
jgi:hypothetical protein